VEGAEECSALDRDYASGAVALWSLGESVVFGRVVITGKLDPDWVEKATAEVRTDERLAGFGASAGRGARALAGRFGLR
jgi:hypothetical protein